MKRLSMAFLLAACAALLCPAFVVAQQAPARVSIDLGKDLGPLRIERIAMGQGGLSDEPMWDNRAAEIRALHPRLIRLFIQEYFDLMPARGMYQFAKLDQSVDLILKTGARPLMSINFKPKVLFPAVDQDVVEPNDWEEWERLVSALVRHYREKGAAIQYWEVANEPDIGEDGGCPYRFKPDSYVRYYRHTAEAILRVDPAARIGGPALAGSGSPILPELLDYCSREKFPLHFVSWHIYSSDPSRIRATIEKVKALLAQRPDLHPETILDEWNMDLTHPLLDPAFQPAFIAETAWQMLDAGLDWSCYYHIRDWHVRQEQFAPFMSAHGAAFMARWWNRMPQFDGLFDFQDTPRPSYFLFKLLSRLTGNRRELRSSAPVRGFATYDRDQDTYSVLLWNYSDKPVTAGVDISGLPGKVTAKRVSLDATTGSNDENRRLHPLDALQWDGATATAAVDLAPWGITFWSIEK